MTSCRWPCSACTAASASSAATRSSSRLADADEDPARERDPQLAGGADRLQPPRGMLRRRALVGDEVGVDRLEHQPLRGGHLAQPREVVAVEHAEVRVRQQPALERALAGPHDVGDEVLVAELGQPRAHAGVDLGALAGQHEQLLDVAPRGAVEQREHLVGRVQVRPVRRERAVLAVQRQVRDSESVRLREKVTRRRTHRSLGARLAARPILAADAPPPAPGSLLLAALALAGCGADDSGRAPNAARTLLLDFQPNARAHRHLHGDRARLRRRARRHAARARAGDATRRRQAARRGRRRVRDPRHPRPRARARARARPRRRDGARADAAGGGPRAPRSARRATSRAGASRSAAGPATTPCCARSCAARAATPAGVRTTHDRLHRRAQPARRARRGRDRLLERRGRRAARAAPADPRVPRRRLRRAGLPRARAGRDPRDAAGPPGARPRDRRRAARAATRRCSATPRTASARCSTRSNGLDRARVQRELDAVSPSFTAGARGFGELNRPRLQAWARWCKRLGITKRTPQVALAFDGRYVPRPGRD